jgi:hypothetical protein
MHGQSEVQQSRMDRRSVNISGRTLEFHGASCLRAQIVPEKFIGNL